MGTDKDGSPEVVQGLPADPWHRGYGPLLPPCPGGCSPPGCAPPPTKILANLTRCWALGTCQRNGTFKNAFTALGVGVTGVPAWAPGRVPAHRDEARDAHPSASCLLGRRVSFRFENTSPLPHIPFPTKPLCQNEGGVPPPPLASREPPVREAVLTSQAGAQQAVSRTFPASFLIPAATASGPGVWLMSYGGGARLWTKWPPTPCLHLLWSH